MTDESQIPPGTTRVLGSPRGRRPLPSEAPAGQQPSDMPADPSTTESQATEPTERAHGPEQARTLGRPRKPLAGEPLAVGKEDLFASRSEHDLWDAAEPQPVVGSLEAWRRRLDPLALALLVILTGLIVLFMLSQALALVSTMATLPRWGQYVVGAAMAVASVAVVLSLGYLFTLYFRLRQSPRVSASALEQLQRRSLTRQAALEQTALAQQRLTEFLQEYPLEEKKFKTLQKLGFDPKEELPRLLEQRRRLLDEARGSDQMWIRDLDQHFLRTLDAVAARRVKRFALQVGLKTAVAPTGFLDAAIVLTNTYLLIGDLCRIYNLRADRWGTTLILVNVAVNTVAATQIDEVTDPLGENIAQTLQEGIGSTLAQVAKALTSRAAEGTANGLLLARLGYSAIRQLRPIRLEKRR